MRLTFENVTHSYEHDEVVLNDLSFDVRSGSLVALVGPSGCGKTTVLSIGGLLLKPSGAGRVLFDGTPVKPGSAAASNVAWIFQRSQVWTRRTVFENVLVPASLARVKRPKERAHDFVSVVGLTHRTRMLAGQMSGGERQRLAVARALAIGRRLVLCDEPTAHLDAESVGEMVRCLTAGSRESGATIFVATHDASVANACDEVIQLRGRTVS